MKTQTQFIAFPIAAAASLLMTFAAHAQFASEPDKFLAQAKVKQEAAQKLRAEANAKLQAAADQDAEALSNECEAQVMTAHAMQLMKADGTKQRAFHIGVLAQQSFAQANRKSVEARNAELKAAQERHDAGELSKAAAALKDQSGIAAALEADAKILLAQAQQDEQAATAAKAEAQRLSQDGDGQWANAARLDPQTHQKMAAKPVKPALIGTTPK
ncbi:MAG TPA: hypothetical protein VN829_23355 [Dongiaceae bacterium]|nr:hypothetical protein [Dongiaceae bacterium]